MNLDIQTTACKLRNNKVAVIVPTYNNAGTLAAVIDTLLPYTESVFVVNDGSTDSTSEILRNYEDKIKVIHYQPNKGKGNAIRLGFMAALKSGFQYAVTIDSDGQHYVHDLEAFVENIELYPGSLLVGNRGFGHENMHANSTFANKFSNFWFRLQTCIDLPDTQSGYRLYPLLKMGKMPLWTSRYEAELELLVFSAWRGIGIRPVPVSVYYAPAGERVSHFRPFRDFFRISLLNTLLVFLAVIYGYPSMLVRWFFKNSKK